MTTETPDVVTPTCPKCGRPGEYVYGETKTGHDPKFPKARFQGGYWVMYRCRPCEHDWTISGTLPAI